MKGVLQHKRKRLNKQNKLKGTQAIQYTEHTEFIDMQAVDGIDEMEGELTQKILKIGRNFKKEVLLEPLNTREGFQYYRKKNFILSLVDNTLKVFSSNFAQIEAVKDISPISSKVEGATEESIISFGVNQANGDVVCSMSNSLVRVYSLEKEDSSKFTKVFKVLL